MRDQHFNTDIMRDMFENVRLDDVLSFLMVDWLVSLFNGISTLFKLFNAKAIHQKEQ